MELLPEVREVLEACGWSEERLIDTAPFREAVEAAGFYWNAAGADFLSRFGGLNSLAPAMGDMVSLDPLSVLRLEAPENIVGASEQVGGVLCPIGSIGDVDLLIDEEGAVYTEFSGCMRFLGRSPEEALNVLLAMRPPAWTVVPDSGWSKPCRET